MDRASAKALCLDASVMRPYQPIYTARPIFKDGAIDPVPEWARATVLDGAVDRVDLDLSQVAPKRIHGEPLERLHIDTSPIPEELLALAAEDAGLGVDPNPEPTTLGLWAMQHAFEELDGLGSGYRHYTLNKWAFNLAGLVLNGHIIEEKARKGLLEAAQHMNRSDGKYSDEVILEHIDYAFKDARLP